MVRTQYTGNMEELGMYTSHTYKYGEDIQDLIWNINHPIVLRSERIKENDKDPINKRIREKELDDHVKRLNLYV